MSNPHETWWKYSPHQAIILTKFHEDLTKIVIFSFLANFWKCAFFSNQTLLLWFLLFSATIFLNKTNGKVALPLFWDFLVKWPDPESVCKGDEEDIATFLQPIGLNNRRARVIKRFSEDFLTKDWIYPKVMIYLRHWNNRKISSNRSFSSTKKI